MTRTDETTLSHLTSRDGTQTGYYPNGEGPPLVLVPGGLGDHKRWSELLPEPEPYRPRRETCLRLTTVGPRNSWWKRLLLAPTGCLQTASTATAAPTTSCSACWSNRQPANASMLKCGSASSSH